jgi:hypothetical protein
MNLKHLLSISFLYLSGTTHALATKVNIGMTNALIFSMNIEYKKIKDYLRYIPDCYKEILQTCKKMGGGQAKTL